MADTGTVSTEWSRPGTSNRVGFIEFNWTSSATQTAQLTFNQYVSGTVGRLATDPGSPAPTADYDIYIYDEDGWDILNGAGVDRHTSTSEQVYPVATGTVATTGLVQIDFAGLLRFVVQAAGTAKLGKARLYYH